jgi:hypothetical protein
LPRKGLPFRSPGLYAAAVLCGCLSATAPARAQSFEQAFDPFAPKTTLWSDPFQKKPPPSSRSPRPLFQLPASGAGKTGFDASNARKRKIVKRKPGRDTAAGSPLGPPTSLAAPLAAFAQAPGTPPPETEIGPVRKKPKRKAHTEPPDPYEQIGLRTGAFDVYPAVELIGGYNSNPGQSASPHGSGLFTVAPELRVKSHWVRHELTADLRGSYTKYSPDETPTLSRPYVNGKLNGRLDVSDSVRIDGNGRLLVSTDNPGSPNNAADLAKLPVFTTFAAGAGVTRTFNRLALTLKGDTERTVYQDSTLTDGTTVSNADRQYDQFGGAVRAGYEFSPGVKPFVEAGLDRRRHDLSVDSSGYQRDSKGMSVSAGAAFKLRGTLEGEISLGYARRTYEDPRFDPVAGPIGNASLIWTIDALNTVKFTASSTIAESSTAGVPGIFYRDAAVPIDHAFRRWLIGSLKFGAGLDTYQGSSGGAPTCDCVQSVPGSGVADRVDHRYFAALGLTYKLNATAQVKGEVRQDWLTSNVSGAGYTASSFLLGVRLQR